MSNQKTKASLALDLKVARYHNIQQWKQIKELQSKVKELESLNFLAGVRAVQSYLESQDAQRCTNEANQEKGHDSIRGQ